MTLMQKLILLIAMMHIASCGQSPTIDGSVAPSEPERLGVCVTSPGTTLSEVDALDADSGNAFVQIDAVKEGTGPLPRGPAIKSPLARYEFDVKALERASADVPETPSAGSVNLVSNERVATNVAGELNKHNRVILAVSPYVSKEMRGLAAAVSLRPDGSAVFLENCGINRTDAFRSLSSKSGTPAAELVLQRIHDPAKFDVWARTLTQTPSKNDIPWEQRNPKDRQVAMTETPPAILATLVVYVVTVDVPATWLSNEQAVCTLTSVAVGDCARLSSGVGATFQLRAYVQKGSVDTVQIVLQPDGGAPATSIYSSGAIAEPSALSISFSGDARSGSVSVSRATSSPAVVESADSQVKPGSSIPSAPAPAPSPSKAPAK